MVSYWEGVVAREIAKTLGKRGKIKKTGWPNIDFRGKDGDLEKDREPRATYPTPPKSELKSRLREKRRKQTIDLRNSATSRGKKMMSVRMMAKSIKTWRESLRLSVEEFADKIGVKRQTVVNWEKGVNWEEGNTSPRKNILERMKAMGLEKLMPSAEDEQATASAVAKGVKISRAHILRRSRYLSKKLLGRREN